MSIIKTEVDRKRNKVTFAEGVVQFVKLDKFPETKVFVYQGKKIESTHSASILIKEKGKEGRDDEGVWVGLGDVKLHPEHENLQVKVDDDWVTIERGVEVSVDIKKVSTGKNGQTYYNSTKGNITVLSTDGVAKGGNSGSAKKDSPAGAKTSYKRDNTGMHTGHAINGALYLQRNGAKQSQVEMAKLVHDVTTELKVEVANDQGKSPDDYDVGASVGHAVLNACRDYSGKGDIESFIKEYVESLSKVTYEITAYIKGGDSEKVSEKKEAKPKEEKKSAAPVEEPPMDFDDCDIPF